MINELCSGYKHDWNDTDEYKIRVNNDVYFPNKEIAEKAVDMLNSGEI